MLWRSRSVWVYQAHCLHVSIATIDLVLELGHSSRRRSQPLFAPPVGNHRGKPVQVGWC